MRREDGSCTKHKFLTGSIIAHHVVAEIEGRIERYLKQAIVDKNPVVASAALVSGIHLLQIRQNDRLAVNKLGTCGRCSLSCLAVESMNWTNREIYLHTEYFGQYGKVLKVSMSRIAASTIQQFPNNACNVSLWKPLAAFEGKATLKVLIFSGV
ncbi:hypothetical protein J1N35_023191 [Gossypium stocksii]|uniref:Uncharacterized protein n=1 Tax=Gossypium stocksii TaxID=47602 RepID=A0A9D3VHV4_9ROSI|nr:hypothetical protein J1N35_023191 [Gossypium stocksii]